LASYIKQRAGYACRYDGDYYDCGDKLEFIKAIIKFGLKHPDFRKALKKYWQQI
jgi:UTP--glucose-1-phosphate uridylyltransferase